MKKVLVVDDSALMRRVVSDIINRTSEYKCEYTAKNGAEALGIIKDQNDVDIILCDIHMPVMDGLTFLLEMKKAKIYIPVVIMSSTDDATNTITALENGAVDFIKKPSKLLFHSTEDSFDSLIISAFEGVTKVNTSLIVDDNLENASVDTDVKSSTVNGVNRSVKTSVKGNKLVALVCSTGGPMALQSVIPKLPANINAPVVMVQHMPEGFTESLANRLNDLSEVTVKEAEEGEIIKKGNVYIAKGGKHLLLKNSAKGVCVSLDDSPAIVGLKPCGNLMYNSIELLDYDEIICVVLTGMGADGTKGISRLADFKNVFIIAQDKASSTVYGMPKAIAETGLVDVICDLNQIAEEIVKKVGVS